MSMMEKIMSKTNDAFKRSHATLEDHGTLADSELAAVSGGRTVGAVSVGAFGYTTHIPMGLPLPPFPPPPPPVRDDRAR